MLHITVIANKKKLNIKVGLEREKEVAARGWMRQWKEESEKKRSLSLFLTNTHFSAADTYIYSIYTHIVTCLHTQEYFFYILLGSLHNEFYFICVSLM